MAQKELITKTDYAAVGEEISHELAADFTAAFEKAYPRENKGFTLGRNIIDRILAQPGCVGLRFYNALNEAGERTFVYVGIGADGKDIVKRTVVMQNGAMTESDAIIGDRVPIFWPFY
jgi:hypothetical protein